MAFLVHNGAGVSSRSHAGAGLQNGTDVVLAAVLHSGDAREDAGADPQNLTKVVVAALKKSGVARQPASADLKNNAGVVLAAVTNNGYARKTRERGPEQHPGGCACGGAEKRLCSADTSARA